MKNQEPSEDTLNRWHQDPNNWKWGFIYYNPDDRRILVLKRLKWTGLTFNFAHRVSHVILILILIMVLVLIMVKH
jgi:uncharacterized membrane protein